MTCRFVNFPKYCKWKGDSKIRYKIDMVISTFSRTVQFTALSISFHLKRMTRLKFPKVPLGDVLKEVIERGSVGL